MNRLDSATLKRLRQANGLSLEQLAERAKIDKQTIWRSSFYPRYHSTRRKELRNECHPGSDLRSWISRRIASLLHGRDRPRHDANHENKPHADELRAKDAVVPDHSGEQGPRTSVRMVSVPCP